MSKENETTYDRVRRVTEEILRQEDTSEEKKLSADEIYSLAIERYENEDFSVKSTFKQYVSNLANNAASRVHRQIGTHGYFYAESQSNEDFSDISSEPEEIASSSPDQEYNRQKEKQLYPVLVNWLQSRGYRANDVSGIRQSGLWSNPDVVGIKSTKTFGGYAVETVSIEAKLSDSKWDQLIFEAVSHRRFANRSYYAFAAKQEDVAKLDPRIRYYSELFQVGILVISLSSHIFDSLRNGQIREAIGIEDAEIFEPYPSPSNYIQNEWQMEFCNRLGIADERDLFGWGEEALPQS